MHNFKAVKATDINENAIRLIGTDWMLITAGNETNYNTMTASWGGLGVLWNKPVVFIFIRPQRYTFDFVEREDYFSCSFYDEKYRDQLNFCGKYSGRDYDKTKETGLIPLKFNNTMAFNQSRLVLECRKIYYQDIDPGNFLAPFIAKNYPKKDYHRLFIGEIASVWIKNEYSE